ncbi:MAG: glycerophosphoryl diester phosphodiesterase membrane domain-containing protein [Chloroflexaceae bacterium]
MQATAQRLRPMNVGDILDTTFRVYRSNFLLFIGITALLNIPMILLNTSINFAFDGVLVDYMDFLNSMMFGGVATDALNEFLSGDVVPFVVILLLVTILQTIVLQPVMIGALTQAVGRRYQQDEPTSVLGAYDLGLGRMAALVGATLVLALIFLVVFGLLSGCLIGIIVAMSAGAGQNESGSIFLAVFMFFGILGMFFLTLLITAFFIVRLMFFPQMIVLEKHGPLDGLSRSWQLVRGSFWRVLGTVLLISLLVQILVIIPGLISGGVIGFVFSDPQDFAIQQSLSTLVGYITQILFLPISIIAYTLLYYDLRVRKEGYDLQLLAQDYAPGSAQ